MNLLVKLSPLLILASCVDLQAEGEPTLAGERRDDTSCPSVSSSTQDFAPVQTAQAGLPQGSASRAWVQPTTWTSVGSFSGQSGRPASHEGTDYIHNRSSQVDVVVISASAGVVSYVREGCPQSSMFSHNNSLRECGSGWGNHVVVSHGQGIYTRYGHMAPNSLEVSAGDTVEAGQLLGLMGNTGRSELRHLHFELGTKQSGFDSCAMSQSFNRVYNPGGLPFGESVSEDYGRIECPDEYEFTEFNAVGGGLCVNQNGDAMGPFTQGMVDKCESWGGGQACQTNQWNESLATAAYGEGTCPDGATVDPETGYCLELDDAFGPFPADMISACVERGGGEVSCNSARWNANMMRWIYRDIR